MNIEILDCTLRDGGYTNNWQFDQEFIINLINSSIESGIENIECGYLSNTVTKDLTEKNLTTRLDSIFSFNNLLSSINKKKSSFFIMIDFNDYNTSDIPDKSNTLIDGIRLAFHKKDINEIYSQAKNIKDKGYRLFIQPMSIHLYDDNDLNILIDISEKLNLNYHDSLYIVDSFGSMDYEEMQKYFFYIDKKLNKDISIGFHLHNNINSAFTNSINFINNYSNSDTRKIIIDTSLTGMGRGAGNIKTEYLLMYLHKKYNIYNPVEILNFIDNNIAFNNQQDIEDIAFFISGINKIHPGNITKLLKEKMNLKEMYLNF